MSILHKFLTFIGLEPENSHDVHYENAYAGHGSEYGSPTATAQSHEGYVGNGYGTGSPYPAKSYGNDYGRSNIPLNAPAGVPDANMHNTQGAAGMEYTAGHTGSGMGYMHPDPKIVFPDAFEKSAKLIGDYFKANHPVIINFENTNQQLVRRILDFASGICYGRYSKIRKVANRVYIMTPGNYQIAESDIQSYIQEAQRAA